MTLIFIIVMLVFVEHPINQKNHYHIMYIFNRLYQMHCFTFILVIFDVIILPIDRIIFILIFGLEMVQGRSLGYGIMNFVLRIILFFILNRISRPFGLKIWKSLVRKYLIKLIILYKDFIKFICINE